MKNKKITWVQWVTNFGTARLARELNCHRNTVKRWILHGDLPSDRLKKEIVQLSKGRLTFNDFFEEET